MHKSRLSKDYELGVENFIKFGFSNTSNSYIRYPCLKCGNCEICCFYIVSTTSKDYFVIHICCFYIVSTTSREY